MTRADATEAHSSLERRDNMSLEDDKGLLLPIGAIIPQASKGDKSAALPLVNVVSLSVAAVMAYLPCYRKLFCASSSAARLPSCIHNM